MANKKTEQNIASESKKISQGIEHDAFMIWQEDNKVLYESLDILRDTMKTTSDIKLAVSIAEFFVNKIVGDPVKKTDVTSGGKSLEVIINTNLDLDETEL